MTIPHNMGVQSWYTIYTFFPLSRQDWKDGWKVQNIWIRECFFLMGGEEVNNIARGVKDIFEIKFQEGTKVYRIGAGLFDEIPRFCFYFKSNTIVNEKPKGCLRAFWVSLKNNLRLAFHIVILWFPIIVCMHFRLIPYAPREPGDWSLERKGLVNWFW